MIGRTISHYDVLETLGTGGMGVVYKARDTQLNRLVALKALSGSVAADPERRSRFLQEAQAASALNHPNIVTIHDVLPHEDGHVIVMELVAGNDVDPTGSRLVYTKHVWDTNVWRLDLLPSGLPAGRPEPLLRSNLVDDSAAFSPDGQSIVFASERSGTREVWLADAKGGRLRQLTSMDSTLGLDPVWDPTGEWIAFEASVGGRKREVYVVSPRGGSPRPAASDPADDWNPRWSLDGRRLLFESERGGKRQVWAVPRDGGEATPAPGERLAVDDHARAFRYFAEETKDGWSIRRQRRGGEAVETVVERAGSWAFALSAKGVYFTGRGPAPYYLSTHIAFLDLASRRKTKIVDLAPGTGSGWGLTVSPDGRTLLYTQCDAETDDLVLVENFR